MRAYIFAALLFTAVTSFAQKTSFDGYKTVNGVKIYCKVIGEGEPILVIHGGPGMPHDYFLPYLNALAKTHKVILYDQRSTGRSGIPKDTLTGCTHKNMIEDIEGLRKAFGIGKLNIMAHSWGAKLAVIYALKYPANLKSIVFCAPATFNHDYDAVMQKYTTDNAYTPKYKSAKTKIQMMHVSAIEIRMRLAFLSLMYIPENIEKVKIVFPDEYADKQTALMRGLSSDYKTYDKDYYPLLGKITCPVLVIHGDADATPVEADERLAKSVKNGKMVRMAQSGHFPFIEETEKFAQVVSGFVK
ncbi:MAG: alpha/beta fold hydrolase [Bacteroidetes bacterium]|nr:alpha/beta fold hydrolase [Bacteroidota bacterium]